MPRTASAAGSDVCVIVPTFNRANLLERTLRSLVGQTSACRIVVVDDASSDETPAVCKKFGDAIVYERNPQRLGLFTNWNHGIAMVEEPFVAIYHDDDIYDTTIVEKEAAILRGDPNAVMVHTQCRDIDDDDTVLGDYFVPWPTRMSGDAFRRCLAGRLSCPVVAQTVMMRTEAIRGVGGFDETLTVPGDLLAWFNIARLGAIRHIQEPLAQVRSARRNANEHGHFQWTVIDERLRVATITQLEYHGRRSRFFRARVNAYLAMWLCREIAVASGFEYGPLVQEYGSAGLIRLARLVPHLGWFAPVISRFRPTARIVAATMTRWLSLHMRLDGRA